jgi:hypothetical protein
MTKHLNAKILRNIQDGAFRRLPAKRRESTNLYLMEEIQLTKSVIKAGHQTIKIARPTAVVFVDDEPMANWSHNCRYLLHDAETGELYQEVNASFPPSIVNLESTLKAFHTPVVAFNPLQIKWQLESKIRFPFRMRKGERYAILFSGASNNRHVNDLEFLYRELVDQYFFKEENITVLNYDGTINYSGYPRPVATWPGDGTPYTMPVNNAGTKAALNNAIDALKSKLEKDDLLLVHTNNHGGHNGTESYLCTFESPTINYNASDFANKLGELPQYADLVVMMEQCHSGGFNDAIIEKSTADRTTFAGACSEGKNSWGEAHFDFFAKNWISAMAGVDPYGAALTSDPDYDHSGKVSSREAFAYADDVHYLKDSPVYSSFGVDAGDQNLHQKWRYIFIYREFILKELTILRDGIDDPIHYRQTMRTKVLPALAELDDQLAEKPVEQEIAQQMIGRAILSIAKEIGARYEELESLIH